MNHTFGILAHVDAGKTTLSESILVETGVRRTAGRVDQKTAAMDQDAIEQRHGITIFPDAASFTFRGAQWTLIDTPGHMDFAPAVAGLLPVLDCAVLVISVTEGIQAHTRNLWRMLSEAEIPTLLFFNKKDLPHADLSACLADVRAWFQPYHADVCLFDRVPELEQPEDALCEVLADHSGTFLDRYLEGRLEPAFCRTTALEAFRNRTLLPAAAGSALKGEGTVLLLSLLSLFCPEASPAEELQEREKPFLARVFRTVYTPDHKKQTLLRCLTGSLANRSPVVQAGSFPACAGAAAAGSLPVTPEKINHLQTYQGVKLIPAVSVGPGDIAVVEGFSGSKTGDFLAAPENPDPWKELPDSAPAGSPPILAVGIESSVPVTVLLSALRELSEEIPSMRVEFHPETEGITLCVTGSVALSVITELLEYRYGIEARIGKSTVIYQETLREGTFTGIGHYEPLRHYAEAVLLLEPAPRGSGIRFQSRCHVDTLAASYQSEIRSRVLEEVHPGVLTGSALTDLTVTLLDGRSHLKHTEGGDFREAVRRAVRQAMMQAAAAGAALLLEPYEHYTLEADAALSSALLYDLSRLSCASDPPVLTPDGLTFSVSGRGPASTLLSWMPDFLARTHKQGRLSLSYDGYDICHNEAEAAANTGYDPDRDYANPAGSIFCSHGAGFEVKWQDAAAYSHCLNR